MCFILLRARTSPHISKLRIYLIKRCTCPPSVPTVKKAFKHFNETISQRVREVIMLSSRSILYVTHSFSPFVGLPPVYHTLLAGLIKEMDLDLDSCIISNWWQPH